MPDGDRLFDAVLDDRFVDQRQHFLGLRLGGGRESGAETRGREDGFSNRRHGGIVTYNNSLR